MCIHDVKYHHLLPDFPNKRTSRKLYICTTAKNCNGYLHIVARR